MSVTWKRLLISVITGCLLLGLVVGAYAEVKEKDTRVFSKIKNRSQKIGKNWEANTNDIKTFKGNIDRAKKNLKPTDEQLKKDQEARENALFPDIQ